MNKGRFIALAAIFFPLAVAGCAEEAAPPDEPEPPATATPAPTCDPPFTVDSVTGRKKYKPECL